MSREIQSVPVTFANTGIIIKSAADEIPLTSYKMLSNAQTDRENSVSVRKGFVRLNSGLPAPPYSAYFLKDWDARQWRYAITNGQLYVAPVDDPDDASVWPLASDNNFGAVNGGANLSSSTDPRALFATYSLYGSEMKPYIFMADGVAFLKHSGGLDSARRVGIPRPVSPIAGATLKTIEDTLIENFDDYNQWTAGTASIMQPGAAGSIWWKASSTVQSARYYYSKYTFTLDDDSETCASPSASPEYIPPLKSSRMYWKSRSYNQAGTALSNPGAFGDYFNDGVSPSLPPSDLGFMASGFRLEIP